MKHNTSCQACAEANDLVSLFPLESSLFRMSRLSSILNSRFRWLSSYINTSGFEVVTKSTFCVFSMDREEVYKKFPKERRLYPVILTGQASSINYFFICNLISLFQEPRMTCYLFLIYFILFWRAVTESHLCPAKPPLLLFLTPSPILPQNY